MGFDSLEAEKAMGWFCSKPGAESAKIVSENDQRSIVELRSGKKIYVPKKLRELSFEEASLLRDCLEFYRKNHSAGIHLEPSKALEEYCASANLCLDENQESYLKGLMEIITRHESILGCFLEDDLLEEVCVIGTGRAKPIFVFDRHFGWLATNTNFFSQEEVTTIANSIASASGRKATLHRPIVNCFLKDGSRLNACIEPVALKSPAITIRKFRSEPFTPLDLCALGSMSAQQAAFLWMAMEADCSMLICGNTGSGKTTLLNSLMAFVPENERIVVAEETPEISVPHNHCVRMSVAEETGIALPELVTNTLRMRPDRVIIGEARNAEDVTSLMDSLLAGQGKGTYATFHAQSAKDAVQRLKKLGAMDMDIEAIDLIVMQKRWSFFNGKNFCELRKAVEIAEPELRQSRICVNTIFEYDFAKNDFLFRNAGKKAFEKICRTHQIGKSGFLKELEKRSGFLDGLRGMKMEEFFREINRRDA